MENMNVLCVIPMFLSSFFKLFIFHLSSDPIPSCELMMSPSTNSSFPGQDINTKPEN